MNAMRMTTRFRSQWASFRPAVTMRPSTSAVFFSTSADDGKDAAVVDPPKSHYFIPRAERGNSGSSIRQGFDQGYARDEGRLVRTNRFCPTRELNYGPAQWQKHKSPYRKIRHLRHFMQSSPFQRLLFPDLFLTSGVAAGLAFYNEVIADNPAAQIAVESGAVFSGATTAIGLLAAFRLNGSYGRYEEGRKFWGEINNSSRDLAGEAMMWIKDPKEKDRMARFVKAFPVGVHWNLNDKGGHYRYRRSDPKFQEKLYSEFYAEMLDIYEDEKDQDFRRICRAYETKQHVPLTIASGMRSIIANNKSDPIYNREMDEQVQRLVACVGQCERVLRTPIPTCFTRHSSRLFFLWSVLLPFGLYPAMGPIGTLPVSVLLSFSVLGIGDIAVQIEEPFNVLPLRQYSEGIYAGVNDIKKSFDDAVADR